MATTTKTALTFQASATQTAGAGDTTGSSIDLSDNFGTVITAEIINGATGPTVPCYVIVEVSNDNSDFMQFAKATAGVANSTTYHFTFALPAAIKYARTIFGGNTAQNVTIEADGIELTSIG